MKFDLSSTDMEPMIYRAVVNDGLITSQHESEESVPWWSFTKTVIAAAALVLVRDKIIALDETLNGRPFTLRQLLRHQAGLTDYGHLADYHAAVARNDEPWSEEEVLARADADTLRYAPGESWGYSNIGYLYIRRLIEEVTQEAIGPAVQRLVLSSVGLTRARFAGKREDLIDVRMGGAENYDPRWVYHGLMVGPLRDASIFLDRLMAGDLLTPVLKQAMSERHPLGGPIPGRPWIEAGYGLGLMIGQVENGLQLSGHTGAGPGSVIAVYHSMKPMPVTCATFAMSNDQGIVERDVISGITRNQGRVES